VPEAIALPFNSSSSDCLHYKTWNFFSTHRCSFNQYLDDFFIVDNPTSNWLRLQQLLDPTDKPNEKVLLSVYLQLPARCCHVLKLKPKPNRKSWMLCTLPSHSAEQNIRLIKHRKPRSLKSFHSPSRQRRNKTKNLVFAAGKQNWWANNRALLCSARLVTALNCRFLQPKSSLRLISLSTAQRCS
jgi:hypothetical protein